MKSLSLLSHHLLLIVSLLLTTFTVVNSKDIHVPGTGLYWKFDNGGWYYGEIIKYNPAEEGVEGGTNDGSSYSGDAGYTILWEDGSVDHNTWDDDVIVQMIENYNSLWSVGQTVYEQQIDGDETDLTNWREGTITDISTDGGTSTYTVRWKSTGVEEVIPTLYDNGSRIDTIVDNYLNRVYEKDNSKTPYEIGTGVYWNFHKGTWLSGTITNYDEFKGYTITWENGDVDEGYDYWSLIDVNEMVLYYNTKFLPKLNMSHHDPTRAIHDIGTGVHRTKGDSDGGKWITGMITDYSPALGYSITWSDGTIDVAKYTDDEIDTMVIDMKNSPNKNKTNGSSQGKGEDNKEKEEQQQPRASESTPGMTLQKKVMKTVAKIILFIITILVALGIIGACCSPPDGIENQIAPTEADIKSTIVSGPATNLSGRNVI